MFSCMVGRSPYMLLFSQTLSTKGQQGTSLLDMHCRGKTCLSTRLDRSGKSVLPLAAFLGQSTIGGTCLEHPLYKDPIPPGVALEKDRHVCGMLDWTGLTPIMTWKCRMRQASAWAYGALPIAMRACTSCKRFCWALPLRLR